MQDNYPDENIIQYIDDEMTMDEKKAFEKLLQEDAVHRRICWKFLGRQM